MVCGEMGKILGEGGEGSSAELPALRRLWDNGGMQFAPSSIFKIWPENGEANPIRLIRLIRLFFFNRASVPPYSR
jgi:hypothetical protein